MLEDWQNWILIPNSPQTIVNFNMNINKNILPRLTQAHWTTLILFEKRLVASKYRASLWEAVNLAVTASAALTCINLPRIAIAVMIATVWPAGTKRFLLPGNLRWQKAIFVYQKYVQRQTTLTIRFYKHVFTHQPLFSSKQQWILSKFIIRDKRRDIY